RHRRPDTRSRRRRSGRSGLRESRTQCRAWHLPRARSASGTIRPETAVGAVGRGLSSDQDSCISALRARKRHPGREKRRVSAKESSGREIGGTARRLAAPAIALLFGAGAMALLLDSGTVHLPPVGPGPGSAPATKIAVSSPATHKQAHKRQVTPPASSGAAAPTVSGSTATGATATPSTTRSAPPPSSSHFRQRPTPRQPPGGTSGSTAPTATPAATPQAAGKLPAAAAQHGLALGHEK